jgi:hypothetical protein
VLDVIHSLGIKMNLTPPAAVAHKGSDDARTVDVYLHTDLTGHLRQDDDGDMSFQYAES